MSHEFNLMAIIIIAISAVLGILFWGMSQSKEIADMRFTVIVDANRISKLEAIQTFTEKQDKGMPAAACYNLLKANPELISSLTCNICGSITIGGIGAFAYTAALLYDGQIQAEYNGTEQIRGRRLRGLCLRQCE